MKGAIRSGKADEASTAGVSGTSDEERSEAPDRSERGLSRCLRHRSLAVRVPEHRSLVGRKRKEV